MPLRLVKKDVFLFVFSGLPNGIACFFSIEAICWVFLLFDHVFVILDFVILDFVNTNMKRCRAQS